ncbi:MAG: hypothetical protein COA54_14440 [Thiotrichaceae bacterium]|nr:MAG: hypothetical protein COA54_14440 [Thiotrichaceae bacterium]
MQNSHNVLILGHGEMGHAMEHLLHANHQLNIWDKFPTDDFTSVVLEEAASDADIVIFCLPVNPHREIAETIAPLLKKDCLSMSIAKGLDEAGQTAAQIFADVFSSHQDYALLYGPMISEEIRANRYAFAQLGCTDIKNFSTVGELFSDTTLHIEHSADITGISWSVILKNVYAIMFGIADELKLGDNMRGYLAVAALRELDQIVLYMGGQAGSPYHLAGLGDLITTATSEDSHHHELGRLLAKGETHNIKGEGIHTLAMVRQYNLFDTTEYPLFQLIESIIHQPHDMKSQLKQYINQAFS